MSRSKTFLILTIIILITGIIRVIATINWDGLLFDEIVSVSIASVPLSEIWSYVRWEMHPPLHFYFLSSWIDLFGSSDITLRLSSVFTGILWIISMYFLGNGLFKSRLAGIYAALIASLMASPLFYSVFVRMYTLLLLAATLSCYFFIKLTHSVEPSQLKKKIYWGIAYLTFTLLALYTHLTALIIPVIHILYLLYLKYFSSIQRSTVKNIFLLTLGSLILYVPWFIHFMITRLSALNSQSWYLYANPHNLFLLSIPHRLLIENPGSPVVSMAVFLFFTLLIVIGMIRFVRIAKKQWQIISHIGAPQVFGILLVVLPIVTLTIIGLYSFRYYTLSAIGLIILVTAGLYYLQEKILTKKITILLMIALLSIPSLQIMRLDDSTWPSIAQFIEDHEQLGDRIITAFNHEQFSVDYYYNGTTPIETFIPKELQENYRDDLERIVRSNIMITVRPENIEEFEELVGDSERVFFVFDKQVFANTYEYYTNWFFDHGWQRITHYPDSLSAKTYVWLLTKIQ